MKPQYLIPETPLMVLPSLMKAFNGNYTKAIIVQQIHFMCSWPKSGVAHDGHRWVWFTYDEFAEQYMPWLTGRNIQKNVLELEKDGLLLSTTRIRDRWDNTKFYRVDESAIAALIEFGTPSGMFDDALECTVEDEPECMVGETLECTVINKEAVQSSNQSPQRASNGGDKPSTANAFHAYENNIGLLTPITADALKDDVDTYGEPWVIDAIAIATKSGKRSLSYVEGILKRWHANGRDDAPATNNTSSSRYTLQDVNGVMQMVEVAA